MSDIPALHTLVRFGSSVPVDARNAALMEFERVLRRLSGERIEVFQERRGDDSKLRALMTEQQRAKL